MTVDPRNPELVWHPTDKEVARLIAQQRDWAIEEAQMYRRRSRYVVVACVLALVVIAVVAGVSRG